MAQSPSHKFGQIIGNLLEEVIYPLLKEFCDLRGLYLDRTGKRGKARRGKKVKWTDKFGNNHDLDFVIEDGGSSDRRGRPVAFIEAAWRRYTKHSRNKAQEIQGAILPIAAGFAWDKPFLGAVVAGVFTDGSIQQMKSVGFNVLYFPYDTVVSAFASVGIKVDFDENTPDEDFRSCVDSIDRLSRVKKDRLKQKLIDLNEGKIDEFLKSLEAVLARHITRVIVCPLFGLSNEFKTASAAIRYLGTDIDAPKKSRLQKIEVIVRYSNGDKIEGDFMTARKAIDFLNYARK